MSMVSGIDASTGQTIQIDSAKLINTYMPKEWADMVSNALDKAMELRGADAEPRNGINVLLDGEYHFFDFDSKSNRQLSESEIEAFQQEYAENPSGNTLWKILATMSQMGIVDGRAAFQEYQMSEKLQQTGTPFNYASVLDGVLARVDNIVTASASIRVLMQIRVKLKLMLWNSLPSTILNRAHPPH